MHEFAERSVMPGLDPGIHAAFVRGCASEWIAGSSPAMTQSAWHGAVALAAAE